jgi:hypothetical protein
VAKRDPERRSGERAPGLGEALLAGRGGREKARLLDLSPSGAALAVADPSAWPLGSPTCLAIELDDRQWELDGWIARHPDEGVAVAFDDPPERARAAIERRLAALS